MAAKKTKKNYVVVHHGNRYIRKDHDANAEALIKVNKGDKFEYLGEVKNGWFKVKVNRKTGWISIATGSIREI